jgi:hypothetical protein
MIEVRFWVDDRGIARGDAPDRWRFLPIFLEDDVQGDTEWTRELRSIVRSYLDGTADEVWEGTGNAWTLILTPGSDEARLELEVLTDKDVEGTVPLEVLDRLLGAWEELVTNRLPQRVAFDAYDPGPNTDHF